MSPWASNDGAYHWPPPELMPSPHRFCTSSHDQSGAPVMAFSAHKTAWPSPPYETPVEALTGTVETYTVPSWYPGVMSMPSWTLRTSVRLHNCLPVAASRATAALPVAAYTVPCTTLTPSGPPFCEL